MKGSIAEILSSGDASVEALGNIWGDRSHQRRTVGNGARTELLIALAAVRDALPRYSGWDAEQQTVADFIQSLTDCWLGEDGWDTLRLIEGVKAAKATTNINQSPPPERGEP